MDPRHDLIINTAATVIVIHHNNRNGGYRGSSAISDDSDNVLALDSEKDEDNNIISMTVTPLKSKVRLKKTTYTMTDIGLTQTLVSTDDRLYSLLQSHPGVSQNSLEKLAGGFASRNKIRDFVTRYLIAKKIEKRKGLLCVSNVAAVTHGVLEDDETEIHEETGRK